jgi:hypothetical protein
LHGSLAVDRLCWVPANVRIRIRYYQPYYVTAFDSNLDGYVDNTDDAAFRASFVVDWSF